MPTLVVETGSGLDPNANSYCDVAFADTYMDARMYTDEWDNLAPTDKARALIFATRTIDAACVFRGYKKLNSQPLMWPRVRAKNDQSAGSIAWPISLYPYVYYDENSIPPELAQATAVQALELARADRTVDQGAPGVSSLGLGQGALTMTFGSGTNAKSTAPEVRKLLAGLVKGFRGCSGNRRVTRVM